MLNAIGIFMIFLFLGMPVAFAIGISGFIFFLMRPEIPWTILVQKSLSTTQSFTMLAIPLFIFAGNLMNNTGITSRLVKLANVLTGHMYGSIGQVSVVLSTLMGGVSGSAVADAAMECRILGPEMTKRGYAPGWSAAINCLSGLIVATIPPVHGPDPLRHSGGGIHWASVYRRLCTGLYHVYFYDDSHILVSPPFRL